MSDLARAVVVAAVLVAGAYVIRGLYGHERWSLAAGPGGTVYRLDRLSGELHHCSPLGCRALPLAVPSRPPAAQPAPARPAAPDAPVTEGA